MEFTGKGFVRFLCVFYVASFWNLQLTVAQVRLPDVIVGDPNDPDKDTLGSPISEKELQSSPVPDVSLDTLSGAEDPIAKSGFFQGDIVIATKDHFYQMIEGQPDDQTSAVRNPSLLWPGGVVPYVISDLFSPQERQIVGQSMNAFHSQTCVSFTPRQPYHQNYIHILKGRGCSSSVGRVGGVQVVSLGKGCVQYGVVVHEFMHAIGFWHEQSRADRDDYVTINWPNVIPEMRFNFDKKSNRVSQDLGQTYDYDSVMHYGAYDFAMNPFVPTILPKVNGVKLGQRRGFSQMDIEGINLLYKCNTIGPEPQPGPGPKPGPGYTTPGPFGTPSPKPAERCYDADKNCRLFAKSGHCDINPSLRKHLCRKSCGSCKSQQTCEDENDNCSNWADIGECKKNPSYMLYRCRASCGTCHM